MELVSLNISFFWKKATCIAGLFFIFLSVRAQLHPVAGESGITFSIRNFGFKTGGILAAPEGDILFNPDDLSKSSFHMTIKSESINTDNSSRDEHLKEEDYFDVKNYPLIRYVSTSVKAGGKKGAYETTGTLTIKNKSKEISMPFTAEKNGNGWLFSGSFKMNRRDFGIGGSSTISNELTVNVKVLAK
jgi:polyisoprenoid-binding protein YceI